MREMRRLTDARTVPVTQFGDRVVVGFDPGAYEDAILAQGGTGRV
jgi:hypothetical protein